jgi:hypothetical protein
MRKAPVVLTFGSQGCRCHRDAAIALESASGIQSRIKWVRLPLAALREKTMSFERLHEISEQVTALQTERQTLMKSMQEDCYHPASQISEFTWQWDDGYGTQKKVTGLRCKCGKRDYWQTGSWQTK